MVTTARALGFDFDIVPLIAPVNLNGGANTGKRVNMKNASKAAICVFAGVGTAASDLGLDVQQADDPVAGNIKDLDIVTTYFIKDELSLDGDETWAKITQAFASEIADVGAAGVSAEHEQLVVVEVRADQLDNNNGFHWLSVNIPAPGATKLGCAFMILTGLHSQRTPENLRNPNA